MLYLQAIEQDPSKVDFMLVQVALLIFRFQQALSCCSQ